MTDLLVHYGPDRLGPDGYPTAWHRCGRCAGQGWLCTATGSPVDFVTGRCCAGAGNPSLRSCRRSHVCPSCRVNDLCGGGSIKSMVRAMAGHRCVRCGHPYRVGKSGTYEEGDELHARRTERDLGVPQEVADRAFEEHAGIVPDPAGAHRTNWSPCDDHCTHGGPTRERGDNVEAAWRILTVHHLTGDKADCRWWNLAALCQRCHLTIQARVVMDRPWPWEHSGWFRPYAAGYYAATILGVDLTREEAAWRASPSAPLFGGH